MEFLYPGFLFAMAALAVPVIIHLFNFRRFKKIPFTNVRFLREIKQQTQSQNKLRHLLILLMRMLALAFLVFAFAQPFIPNKDAVSKAERQNVSVFVDNSFSMEGESAAGAMIEVAKNRAVDIAMAYAPTDRFQLLTHDFEGKHQRLVSRDIFIEWVQDVELSPQSKSLTEIYMRQSDLLQRSSQEGDGKAFIISDFQRSRYNLDELPNDTTIALSLVHLERNDVANLYIDSVWFDTPVRKLNDNENIKVRVVNSGADAVENVPVRLEVDGNQRALASLSLEGRSQGVVSLQFVHESAGLQVAHIEIQDNPVTYDDRWYFSYDVFDEINILSIREAGEERDALASVFAGDPVYQYTAVSSGNVDYAAMPTQQLVVLSSLDEISSGLASELSTFVQNGGSVWFIPSRKADLNSVNTFMAQFEAPAFGPARVVEDKVSTLNTEHPLYRGIFENIPKNPDLPKVFRHYNVNLGSRSTGDVLMGLSGGSPFLAVHRSGRGQLYVLNTSLHPDESNFARHALFVATALRIAELSQGTALRNITLSDGAYFNFPATVRFDQGTLRLKNQEENVDVIPLFQLTGGQYMVTPGPQIDKAGLYKLSLDEHDISAVGINYSRSESNLQSFSRDDLETFVASGSAGQISVFNGTDEQLGRQVMLASSGTPLWKICIILALLFLLSESLLLRFWKTRTA